MPPLGDSRRRAVALLASGALLILVLLGALQAFNTSNVPYLTPETSGQTLAFTSLTVLVFLLLLVLLVLLLRNILKIYADQSSSALGARLRTRMAAGAALIALMPAVFMFLFSFQLMNRSIDRWFSPNTSQLREDSTRVVQELVLYVASNARSEAEAVAESGAPNRDLRSLQQALSSRRLTLQGGFMLVYDENRNLRADFQAPPESSPATLRAWLDESRSKPVSLNGPLSLALLSTAQRRDNPIVRIADQEYVLGLAVTGSGKIVVSALPLPRNLNATTARIRSGADEYWQLFRNRNRLRTTFFLLLLIITALVFFSSVWLAMFLSRQITRPVEALAEAMNGIAAGNYGRRVLQDAAGEMGDLIQSFNHMAADLEASRRLAETSSAQLTAANRSIEERRRELETIVETIPSGVVTLNASGQVLQANRAFAELLALSESSSLAGRNFDSLLPSDCVQDFASVIRRGQRMGAASTEVELRTSGRVVHLAVTGVRLELGSGSPGSVLVVEDTTELLRAQRQLAWKEVAQRVAHEIKNPLTPIALSADRIARHLDRGSSDSPNIIRKCSQVILGCVGTLRTLVDQFSALAQFPVPQPRSCDVNQVVNEAIALFSGRLEGITVQSDLEPGLPAVLADPEALRRAFANLIDNAAEAMQGSLLRILDLHTSVSEDGSAVEVAVSDTGRGLTDEIRERLFLPFYSTKHRGTGLGLAIAAKIVQEHGGSIRAESNSPKGARFLVRIPLMDPVAQEPAPAPAAASTTQKGMPE